MNACDIVSYCILLFRLEALERTVVRAGGNILDEMVAETIKLDLQIGNILEHARTATTTPTGMLFVLKKVSVCYNLSAGAD